MAWNGFSTADGPEQFGNMIRRQGAVPNMQPPPGQGWGNDGEGWQRPTPEAQQLEPATGFHPKPDFIPPGPAGGGPPVEGGGFLPGGGRGRWGGRPPFIPPGPHQGGGQLGGPNAPPPGGWINPSAGGPYNPYSTKPSGITPPGPPGGFGGYFPTGKGPGGWVGGSQQNVTLPNGTQVGLPMSGGGGNIPQSMPGGFGGFAQYGAPTFGNQLWSQLVAQQSGFTPPGPAGQSYGPSEEFLGRPSQPQGWEWGAPKISDRDRWNR